jgi:hypothetical protein
LLSAHAYRLLQEHFLQHLLSGRVALSCQALGYHVPGFDPAQLRAARLELHQPDQVVDLPGEELMNVHAGVPLHLGLLEVDSGHIEFLLLELEEHLADAYRLVEIASALLGAE